MHLIEADNITVTHKLSRGGKLVAIQDLRWQVSEGLFTSVVGPSGCGKSTLLRAVAGLKSVDEGNLRVALPEKRSLENIAMAFQAPTLMPWLTVEENALLAFRIVGESVGREIQNRFDRLLEIVGLGNFRHAYPYELSGGMQMRAALVRAFITRAKLILMDEPFAALDEVTRDRMCSELERLWLESGNTVVFVTHNLSEAVLLSDKIVLLSDRPSRVIDEFDVTFPRPRTFDLRTTPEFNVMLARLRKGFSNAH